MIPSGLHQAGAAGPDTQANMGNISVRFCSKLVLVAAAAAVWAAPPETVPRTVSVVRPDSRTGKLVRSMVIQAKPVAGKTVTPVVVEAQAPAVNQVAAPQTGASPNLDEAVARIAEEHSLPPQLIHSVIKIESNYNPYAVSSKGALGIMQLIPETARRFGVKNVFNPVENIQGGARYLRYLLDLFDGSYPLALAAYNAGEAAVAKYGGIPPYPETQNYVILVRRQLELAKKASDARQPAARPQPETTEAKADAPVHVVEVIMPDGSVRYVTR
jgi:soluble lytic murein transglycosylase-like protein